jgi:hypothetical protein
MTATFDASITQLAHVTDASITQSAHVTDASITQSAHVTDASITQSAHVTGSIFLQILPFVHEVFATRCRKVARIHMRNMRLLSFKTTYITNFVIFFKQKKASTQHTRKNYTKRYKTGNQQRTGPRRVATPPERRHFSHQQRRRSVDCAVHICA